MKTRNSASISAIKPSASQARKIRPQRPAVKARRELAVLTASAAQVEDDAMSDTRPNPENSKALKDNGGPNDDPQDHDSLQAHARRETSKAEGEDPDEGRRPSTSPPIANPD